MEILDSGQLEFIKLDRDESLQNVISSERLSKDVETLMNSSFWINALKDSRAFGIGTNLYFQLIESHHFMKNFVKFSVNTKKIFFKNLIVNQLNDEKKSQCSNISTTQDYQSNTGHSINRLLSDKYNLGPRDSRFFLREHEIVLDLQFIVECVFLAILDLDDYIGTSSDIAMKIIYWFPEMRKATFKIKSLIESILNSTPCFKRLMNQTKNYQKKPIILGKRQYIWSVDQKYLKPFIRYFYNLNDKKQESKYAKIASLEYKLAPITLQLTTIANEPHNQTSAPLAPTPLIELNTLFNSWKNKIEHFKLLMEIKHNNHGFSWCDPSLLSQSSEILNKLDFMQLDKPFKRPKHTIRQLQHEFNYKYESKSFIKPNFMPNLVKKKTSKRLVNKALKQTKPMHQQYLSQNSNTNYHQNNDKVKKRTLNNTNAAFINNQLTVALNNNSTHYQELTDDTLIYNEECKSQLNAESNSKIVTNLHPSNEIMNGPSTNAISSISSGNIINGNCTYFNLTPIFYAPTSYYQQPDLNVPVMVESNVESSDFNELLLSLRGDNEIENDNLFIFNSKY